MITSPAIASPKPGDPITAKWAAGLADALNSCANPANGQGEVSTPFGKAAFAPQRAQLDGKAEFPMPFDCCLYRPSGSSSDKVCIWLPNGGAEFVVYNGMPLGPAQGQNIGTNNTAWVEIGTAANDAAHYIYLKLHTDANGEVDGWAIEDTAAKWSPSSGGTGLSQELPKVLLAYYYIASDANVPPPAGTDNKWPSGRRGLVQYRHGTVVFADAAEILDTDESPGNPPGESVNRWQSTPQSPDPRAAIQLRQFHDISDHMPVKGTGETGSAPAPDDLDILMRLKGPGSSVRPKLVYVHAESGPFWVKGGDASQNFGSSLKIGTPAMGYITISAVT